MKSKQKVFVILTPGFPASESDSTCLPMQQELVRMISKMYPDIHIVVLSFQYPYCKKKYQWFDATVFSFNGKNRGGVSKLLLRQKLYSVLRKIKKEQEILGLLSFWLNECALVGKRFGEKFSIPHYCWLLGQDARKANKYPKKLSVKENELIALSDFLQEEFERNHNIRPFTVIPPGVPVGQLNGSTRDIDLLAAGSLIPLKQFEIFLELVAEIKKHLPGVKAVLAGQGPEKEKLQRLIIQLGIKENISLAGELPYNEVMRLMRRTKVFIHPSSYEGFAGVFLEALSAGAHVISFCRSMKEEIRQWHIVNTKAEMKEKAFALLRQRETRFEQLTNFPIEVTAQKLMALYCYVNMVDRSSNSQRGLKA
jgi:glycosyltransferase involved in cell wall biosynthesis